MLGMVSSAVERLLRDIESDRVRPVAYAKPSMDHYLPGVLFTLMVVAFLRLLRISR
jgi:hypothetical protein